MKGKTFDIYVDEYAFTVEVIDYYYQRPLGKWADSDLDCYGYEEIDYKVLGGFGEDEDGDSFELTLDEAESISGDFEEVISKKLLEEIRDYGDDY